MPNRLATAASLYLRKHADNPIDWWPWCDEALNTAAATDKPIFLSIGYSSCHWCTVMEGEAFSDPDIAAYMNQYFLPIKVDREERPDLDSIYMQALQMITGQGGWPLNIFLSPDDRVPFYAGTYFPVEPRYGRPGFLQVLQTLRRFYDREKGKLTAMKQQILENLQQSLVLSEGTNLTAELLQTGLDYSTGILLNHSPGPSFPMIPYAEAALRGTRLGWESKYEGDRAVTARGMALALGGIYDHVAGGWHRYTVDSTWTVPHFEKMLYDNGQIMEYLANLWSRGITEPAFERAIAGTVQWLKREMTAPAGYFYAAQDADSFTTPAAAEPEEGAFYIWSNAELQQLLTPDQLTALATAFDLSPDGNFDGRTVLQRQHAGTLSDTVETALGQLFIARYGSPADQLPTFPPACDNQTAKSTPWPGRIPAVTDPKLIVAWNSLMISGLARAAAVFQHPDYLHLACTAANFILQHQWEGDRLHRLNYDGSPSVLAQSEDYALLIKALLDIQQAALGIGSWELGGQRDISAPSTLHHLTDTWLNHAIRVQTEFDQFLWSVELGGYYNTANDASQDLLIRERSYADNATPSANGIAAANLIRLALLTDDLQYLDQAEQTLLAFASVMQRSPQACPSLFSALDWFHNHTLIRTTPEQCCQLAQHYLPTVIYRVEPDLPTGAIGLVCAGFSCQEPAHTSIQSQQQVDAISRRVRQ